jgi:hypothetical protein
MVCDLSTFDSMAQRFGRVNRFGNRNDTRVDVLYPVELPSEKDIEAEGKKKGDKRKPSVLVDGARRRTLHLLRQLAGDASPLALSKLDPQERVAAFAPKPEILPVSEILFDAWAMTTIRDKMPGRPPVEGRQLKAESRNQFGQQGPPTLVRVYRDKVARNYTDPANCWATVTPVILPGHDDHKPAKTCKLIEAALAQSGVEQPCTFEWSAFSRFPKSLTAHKYNRHKKPSGYIRPNYLETQTAIHLTLKYDDEANVPGPLAIGAGRHCGFGLMAGSAQ